MLLQQLVLPYFTLHHIFVFFSLFSFVRSFTRSFLDFLRDFFVYIFLFSRIHFSYTVFVVDDCSNSSSGIKMRKLFFFLLSYVCVLLLLVPIFVIVGAAFFFRNFSQHLFELFFFCSSLVPFYGLNRKHLAASMCMRANEFVRKMYSVSHKTTEQNVCSIILMRQETESALEFVTELTHAHRHTKTKAHQRMYMIKVSTESKMLLMRLNLSRSAAITIFFLFVHSFVRFFLIYGWFVVHFCRMMAMSCCINCDAETVIFIPLGLLLAIGCCLGKRCTCLCATSSHFILSIHFFEKIILFYSKSCLRRNFTNNKNCRRPKFRTRK